MLLITECLIHILIICIQKWYYPDSIIFCFYMCICIETLWGEGNIQPAPKSTSVSIRSLISWNPRFLTNRPVLTRIDYFQATGSRAPFHFVLSCHFRIRETRFKVTGYPCRLMMRQHEKSILFINSSPLSSLTILAVVKRFPLCHLWKRVPFPDLLMFFLIFDIYFSF